MPDNSFEQICLDTVQRFRDEPPSRTPSLLATVFGDLVEAHGREIWLGSLVRLMEPMGVNERLVRTAIYRLSQDGTVSGDKVGRRSYYTLTDEARARVQRYEQRVYYVNRCTWDGQWHLVFTGTQRIDAEMRAEIRKRMIWLGFGVIAPNVYGHPVANMDPVWALFDELGVSDQVVVMNASNFDRVHGLGTHEMVRQCFNLDRLLEDYQEFVERFEPLARALERNNGSRVKVPPEDAFVLRSMVIHQYRRILLRDPDLPEALLPDNWPGLQAQRICAAIYRAVFDASERHARSITENRHGPYGPVEPDYRERFQRERH